MEMRLRSTCDKSLLIGQEQAVESRIVGALKGTDKFHT